MVIVEQHLPPGGGEARGTYNFRRAYEDRAFIQSDLVSASTFGGLVRDRGVGLALGESHLEQLDEIGALRPIAFSLGPYLSSYFVPGSKRDGRPEVVLREEVAFVPWKEYAWELSGHKVVSALYSPWQLLYARRAVDDPGFRVSLSVLLDDRQLPKWADTLRVLAGDARARWVRLDQDWRPKMLLLVRIQNRYFPFVKGSSVLLRSDEGDLVDALEFEQERFDPGEALGDLSLTSEHVKRLHSDLSMLAWLRDPGRDIYMLTRMLPYRERERFKGELRRVHDLYDACDVLRRFYFDLSGEILPDADESSGFPSDWKERYLGHERRLSYSPEDLKTVLKGHSIYPHGVHLLVEGDTEIELFPRLFAGLYGERWRERSIKISNIYGVGNHRAAQELLAATGEYARFVVLVLDDEGEARRYRDLWVERGLLRDEHGFLWRDSLEEDNFSYEELVAIAGELAAASGGELNLDAQTLKQRYEAHKANVGTRGREGLATYLVKLAGNPEYGSMRLSKTEFVAGMARILVDEALTGHWAELAKRRRIFELLITLDRLVSAT
jgi:hypothetical protein